MNTMAIQARLCARHNNFQLDRHYPRRVSYTAPVSAQGDQTLQPRVESDIKVFDLTTSVIKWNILQNKQVMAYAFNQQVPGPRIRVTEGDRVRINVTNNLPESTTVH